MKILFVVLSEINKMSPEEVLFWFSLPFLAAYFFYFFSRYPPSRDFFYNKVKWNTPIDRKEFLVFDSILNKNNPYYANLSANGKAKFINRLKHFLTTKKFIGKEGQLITPEIEILISGSAVQLTYGLNKFVLAYFHTIFVYPSIFFSKLLRRELKGATFGGGVICLSWIDFKKGYEIPDDRINLGLHEMAHALKIDVLKGDDFDSRFAWHIDEWNKTGERELERMQLGKKSFLRNYGGKNEHEFFSVCVENFFEAPGIFKEKLPEIFEHLCLLLNQDPLNKARDYEHEER